MHSITVPPRASLSSFNASDFHSISIHLRSCNNILLHELRSAPPTQFLPIVDVWKSSPLLIFLINNYGISMQLSLFLPLVVSLCRASILIFPFGKRSTRICPKTCIHFAIRGHMPSPRFIWISNPKLFYYFIAHLLSQCVCTSPIHHTPCCEHLRATASGVAHTKRMHRERANQRHLPQNRTEIVLASANRRIRVHSTIDTPNKVKRNRCVCEGASALARK